jgi:hypothetical protein
MKQKYDANAKLLFTDTDSLCYEVKTHDIYKDMLEDAELFDTSEYAQDHLLYSIKTRKMKHIWNSNSRICSFEAKDVLHHPIHREQTAKGIKKSVTKKKKDMLIIKPAYSIRSRQKCQ